MTDQPGSRQPASTMIHIERLYPTSADKVWNLWTTSKGIESWWAPDGFKVQVRTLDLRPGGELVYAMTATAPEQIDFMKKAGMPVTTVSKKTFTEVVAPRRLAYQSLVDFVPGHEPYEHLTVVDLIPSGKDLRVVMTVEPLHDDVWTQRLVMGRENELANLSKVIEANPGGTAA